MLSWESGSQCIIDKMLNNMCNTKKESKKEKSKNFKIIA